MSDWPSISEALNISDLDGEPRRVTLEAAAEDLSALAEHFDVPSVERLKGEMDVTRHGTLIRVAGSIDAELGRTCVVSLEPMRELINENFAMEFTTEVADEAGEDGEGDLDAPEPLSGEVLELADVLMEQLVLAMNPHPRKEGAEAPEDPGAGEGSSPFDVLKGLKS